MYASFLGISPCFARTPRPADGSPVSDASHLEIFHQPPAERVLQQAPRETKIFETRGFTLIEAIAVLLLLGVLSAVIVSSYASTQSNTLVSEEATLKGHLRFAQLRAMNDQVSWGIGLGANAYTFLRNGIPAPHDLPGEDSAVHNLPSGVSITLGAGTTVAFDQWGSPGPANMTITLSSGLDSRTIPITGNTGFIP